MPHPKCTSGDRDDPNTIRILIATDNHVGYEERDPIRKDDSWKTFDEILRIAKERDVRFPVLSRLFVLMANPVSGGHGPAGWRSLP